MNDIRIFLSRKEKKWNNRYFNKGFKKRLVEILGNKHLDFGCGFGYLAFLLAKDFPKSKVYGIDIKKEQIKLGQQKYKLRNLHLKCTGKIAGEFDSISAFFVMHHLEERTEHYMHEFYKHLSPKGKILIFDFRKVSKVKYKRWHDKKTAMGEYNEGFEESYSMHNKWTLQKFCSLMEKHGFRALNAEEAGDYWFFYSGEKTEHESLL
jgi:cyclopropane fatty-acyl-phospholipid synthase-like methyltransferase